MRSAAILVASALVGCSPYGGGLFNCDNDQQCTAQGAAGICQPTTGLCSFADGDCPSGQRYGGHAGELSYLCVGTSGGEGVDARVATDVSLIDAPPGTPCYGGLYLHQCLQMAPMMPVMFGDATIDTSNLANCTPVTTGGNLEVCVIAGSSITINGHLKGVGSRPLVLIAETDITITSNGELDVASHRGLVDGAANNSVECKSGTNATKGRSGGGGYGGSFGGKGGAGDTNDGGTGGQSPPALGTMPGFLHGGCPGSDGGGNAGSRGRGGGAVYLIAKSSVRVDGRINASGEGGGGGGGTNGGGGGGSGGMIGIDSPSIVINGKLYANGGGGAEGGGKGTGRNGGESVDGAVARGGTGGANDGGAGGDGAAGTSLAGKNAANDAKPQGGGGGGGGGGAGVIRLFGTRSGSGTLSPPAS